MFLIEHRRTGELTLCKTPREAELRLVGHFITDFKIHVVGPEIQLEANSDEASLEKRLAELLPKATN